jgi:hypothetical protein
MLISVQLLHRSLRHYQPLEDAITEVHRSSGEA